MNEKAHKIVERWASYFSSKNRNSILSYEDYVQEAYLAILEGEPSYDIKRGSYNTWASTIVYRRLSEYASLNNSLLKATKRSILLAAKAYLLESQGISSKKSAEILNISYEKYLDIKNLLYVDSINDDEVYITPSFPVLLELETSLSKNEFSLLIMLSTMTIKEIANKLDKSYHQVLKDVKELSVKVEDILSEK